jgi:5-methylthioadenosine/S-adenosylhomocysteine deaminase
VQTLITNAFIYTADENWRSYVQGALLVENDRIAWIGDQAAWPDAASSQGFRPDHVLDLRGAVVIPGLVNVHAHGGLSVHRGVCDEGDLFGWAKELAPHTSSLVEEDLVLGCYLAIMAQVASGTTCTCDCTRYGVGIFARVANTIGLRSISGALVNSPELRPQGRHNWPSALHETEAALVEFATSNRSRFFLGAHSPYNCTPELLVKVKKEAERLAIPFNIHVAETQTEVDQIQAKHGRRPVEWLESLGVLDQTTLIDHAVWLSPEETEIVAKRGAAVAHCPISNAKLASGVDPIPDLRRQGVVVGLGTDSTLSHNSQNMFEEMKFAVLIQRIIHLDGHILTARDALRMATLEAASAVGWADEIGSLSPGKQADLVVLNLPHPQELTAERVESDLVYACGPDRVQTVMVAGEIIYDRGCFTRFDPDLIHAQIEARYHK